MTVDQPALQSIHRPDGTIELPGAPAIPGLRFRRWRGEADVPGLVDVNNATNAADGDPQVYTPERMRNDYANLTNADPEVDLIVAEIEDRVVGWGQVEWEDQNDGDRAYICYGFVHPEWRRRGLGRAMLHHDVRRLREIAAAQATDRPSYLASWGHDANAGNVAMLESEGWFPVRHFYLMVRPDLDEIEEPPIPEGLEVRPVSAEDFRKVFLADNEAFRDHFGGIDDSDAAYRRWTGSDTFDLSLHVIAWDGDEVAGGVICSIDPAENERNAYRRGLLDSVFTGRPYRKRGLARALMARSLLRLRERGMTSAYLGVDAENPNAALHLYEVSGFRVDQSSTAWRKHWEKPPRLW